MNLASTRFGLGHEAVRTSLEAMESSLVSEGILLQPGMKIVRMLSELTRVQGEIFSGRSLWLRSEIAMGDCNATLSKHAMEIIKCKQRRFQ